MGIWSIDGFSSDEALDWVQSLDPDAGAETVLRALRHVVESSDPHLDAERAQIVLAAAELVAALYGHPARELPDVARRWLKTVGPRPAVHQPDLDALVLATRGLDLVVTTSALSEIFSQRAEEAVWRGALDDLRMRLAAAGPARELERARPTDATS